MKDSKTDVSSFSPLSEWRVVQQINLNIPDDTCSARFKAQEGEALDGSQWSILIQIKVLWEYNKLG